MNGLMKPCNLRIAPVLCAMLNDNAVLFLCLHNNPAFADVMAHRFLDVDVFSCLSPPYGHQGMPMVGRGNGEGV
ncbi:MAG: hypothetical protein BWY09_00684 [Candidatus Hydrogenedentes bacterium ADurb.Bin179]|nr:MAG: hypothetical protein BWY09_00684 [Candidatus Hydrogenedentes bacterium ADurb.Bin179]